MLAAAMLPALCVCAHNPESKWRCFAFSIRTMCFSVLASISKAASLTDNVCRPFQLPAVPALLLLNVGSERDGRHTNGQPHDGLHARVRVQFPGRAPARGHKGGNGSARVTHQADTQYIDSVPKPGGKRIYDGADVVDATGHAFGNCAACARRRKAVKAGNYRRVGHRVDEINPDVVLSIIQVIRGGHNEPKACESLQRIDIVDRVVLISMREDNDREWTMSTSSGDR